MKRYADFNDGTSVDFYRPDYIDHEQAALKASLSAESVDDALASAVRLPVIDYGKRLTAFRNIVERFEGLDSQLHDALIEAMNENALNLAAKTLPLEKVEPILKNASIPLDDIGFARPPRTSEAMEVALCWDATKDDDVYTAAVLMFNEIKDPFTEQDLEALDRAKHTGDSFTASLRKIIHEDIKDSGYYDSLSDY